MPTIDARTPFRSIGDVSPETIAAVLRGAGSPLKPEHFAACRGYSALALAQCKRESSYGTSETARRTNNPLGLMELDGSTLMRFPRWEDALAEWRWRITDPGYKTKPSPYYPTQAAGFLAGYDLSLLGYLKIYVGGPGCLAIKDGVCGNGETFREGAGLTGLRPPPASPSINWYAQEVMRDLNAWLTTTPAPGPNPEPEPEPIPGEIVFGRVPKPTNILYDIVEKPEGMGWSNYGPRATYGVVLHRVQGRASTTAGHFRNLNDPHGRNALTDWGVDASRIYCWNNPDDGRNRSPWASDGPGASSGDGIAWDARFGAGSINRYGEAIEIDGFERDPVSEATIRNIVALIAWRMDRAGVPWDVWPKHPKTGLQAIYWHNEFQSEKGCPWSVVMEMTDRIIEGVRDVLRRYQTGG